MDTGLRRKLKEIREEKGLGTIDEAAKTLGSSRRTVGDYERGHRLPDIDYLATFAKATGSDLRELIDLRLLAAGHGPERHVFRETSDQPYNQAVAMGPLRGRLALSVMPAEWSMFLTELVVRGTITIEAAKEIADFWDNWQPSRRWLDEMEDDAS